MQFNGPVYLQPPKTGSTTLVSALVENNILILDSETPTTESFLDKKQHWTYDQYELSPDLDYAISVRSPYTRYVSLFFQCWWRTTNKVLEPTIINNKSITQYKKYLLSLTRTVEFVSSPCVRWLDGITGVVHVIRFESLADDVRRVYGIDINAVEKIEKGGLGTDYKHAVSESESIAKVLNFYDDSTIALINNHARTDFDKFGYTQFKNYQDMMDFCEHSTVKTYDR